MSQEQLANLLVTNQQALGTEKLNRLTLKLALEEAGLSDEIAAATAEQVLNTVATNADAAANTADATAKGANTTATFNLTAALKGLWATMMAHPAVLVLAALTAITAAIVYATGTAERAVQKQREYTEELKQEYSTLQGEVQSLTDELDTVKSRIDELQGKGSLSFVEQEELSRLEKQNELLAKQIELRKQDAAEKAKETNESITDEFELEYNTVSPKYQSIKPGNQVTRIVYAQGEQEEITTGKAITQLELYDELIERAKELDALRKSMTVDEWLASGNQSELDWVNGEIDQMSNGFGTLARKVEDAEGSGAEAFKTYYDLFKLGQDAQNGIFWSTAANVDFNKVWDDSKFKSVRDKLQSLANEGGVTVDVLNGDEFKDFLAALGPDLTDTGDKMENLASHINSLCVSADDGASGLGSLKAALAGLSDETTVLRDAMAKLDEGTAAFDKWIGSDDNLKSLLDKFPDLRDELEAYDRAIAAGEDPQKAFITLQRAMDAALRDFNANKVYDGVQDVIDAFNSYGARSNQVLQAVQNLDQYIPGLTNQLYGQDNAFSHLNGTTELTADAFYEYCAAAIEAERTSREINISNLTTDLSDLAAMAMTAGHSMKEAMGLAKDEAYNRSGESFGVDDSMAKLTEWYEASMANLEGARNRWRRDQSSKKSSGSEVYVPDVDPLYQYLQTVEDINDELDRFDIDEKLLDEDDFEGKNQLIGDRIEKLEDLKTALHELNDARDAEINTAVEKLNGYGDFQATYDAESGQALIHNMDALKGLTGDTAKAAEELISAIENGSKAAVSTSKEYMEALARQNDLLKEQKELREEEAEKQADDALDRIKNRIARLQNRQEVFAANIDHQNVMHDLGEEKQAYQEMIDLAVRRGAELRAAGAKNDDPELAKWSQTYFEGLKGVRDTNRKMVDEILKPYDEFISNADTYSWWDNIDDTKADVLGEKLAKIHDMYQTGLIPDAEMYKELVNETAEALYKEQLDAIDQTIEYTKKLIEEEIRLRKEELEEQVDDYKKIVDLKKESLRASKDEADYQRSVAEKTKAIASLQQQINTLALSDDRRDIAERKKLEEELAELQGELADTQADHTLEAQEKALDDSYDAFEKEKNDEIKKLEATIDTEGKLYALAIKRINGDWDALYSDLMEMNSLYWDGIAGEAGIKGAWDTAKSAASEYFDVLEARQGLEKKYVSASGGNMAVGDTEVYKDKYGLDWDTHKTVQEKADQMRSNSNAWHAAKANKNDYLADTYVSKNEDLVKEIEGLIGKELYRDGDGVWHINDGQGTQLYKVYHKGGIVGSNEEFAKLEKGEMVVPKEHVQPTMKMLEWCNSLASKMRGLFSGGGIVSSTMSDAIKGAPLSPAAGAIVNNNAPSFVVNAPVEVKYDGSASPADAKRFGENVASGMVEAFRRKGIGTGAKPLGVNI